MLPTFMRVAWSSLIVLVLLAPFGRVGITATPVDADVITMPVRGASPAVVQMLPERDGPEGDGCSGCCIARVYASVLAKHAVPWSTLFTQIAVDPTADVSEPLAALRRARDASATHLPSSERPTPAEPRGPPLA